MKICCVVGARPQFIKAAALVNASKTLSINLQLIHTGQHFDSNMSEIFFNELRLPSPHFQLNLGGLSHGAMTGRMIEELERIFQIEKPDNVIVFGDTNSTLAASLAASKMHIPLSHIEAGLRSFNKKMPEEINRILSDHCSDFLFTPTLKANENLMKEAIDEKKIHYVGDIMMDTLHFASFDSDSTSTILKKLNIDKKSYALATLHRAENTHSLEILKNLLLNIVKFSESLPVIFPLHPATKQFLIQHDLYEEAQKKLILLEPLGYLDMIQLEKYASVILTDSGGIQKEAYFFNVPCITLRNETEWVELIDEGYNFIVGNNPENLNAIWNEIEKKKIVWKTGLYGNGDASKKIFNVLLNSL